MSLTLLKLPFLAYREVVRSMNIREIVLFPQLSNKCRNIVRVSIPKDSSLLLYCFISLDSLKVVIKSSKADSVDYQTDLPVPYKIGDEYFSAIFTSSGDYGRIQTEIDQPQTQESMMDLFKYFIETLNNPAIFLNEILTDGMGLFYKLIRRKDGLLMEIAFYRGTIHFARLPEDDQP
ncbi:hypothetical protein CAEBREN_25589 [Caenorhabditis brenneri]|uniref:F-box domain-containing protein n=1 Tax=Caenorhabditis brenneri TaxID=135651 RepID=G0NJ58_CAEBE|nr:hypothetical protein CAEBREN_25589 [Caenorhabditis brenneri]